MAKGDIVARLILNSKDFDGKIAKSKKEVYSMKNLGKEVFGGMASALKGYAVAAGAAVTVSEAFKAFIGSSQGLTDAWGRSLEVAKTSFDNFMYSVANADFTAVSGGLEEMAARAKDVYNAFDQLANTQMATQFTQRYYQMLYKQAETRAVDKNAPRAERERALREMETYAQMINRASQTTSTVAADALKRKFASKNLHIRAEDIDRSMLIDAFTLDANPDFSARREAWSREYAAYLAKSKAIPESVAKEARALYPTSMIANNAQAQAERERFVAKRERELQQELASRYRGAIVYNIALEMQGDEALKKDIETFLLSAESSNTGQELLRSVAERRNQLYNEMKGAAAKGSATSRPRLAGLPGMPAQAVDKASLVAPTLSDEKQYQLWHETRPAGWADAVFFEQEMKAMKEAQGEAEQLTNVFNTLGDAIGGSASNMLNFAGSLTDAVAAMVPFLSYLQAEAIQHDANANAAMKQAAANTLAAYSGIPFAGLALGAAAVASIVGVMKSLPMLANGGVVTGPTVAMIGEAGKEAVLPLDRLKEFVDVSPREIHVTGEIRAQGKDLVVAIDNYNKVRRVK